MLLPIDTPDILPDSLVYCRCWYRDWVFFVVIYPNNIVSIAPLGFPTRHFYVVYPSCVLTHIHKYIAEYVITTDC